MTSKKTLNQNAIQSLNLFLHLPFILRDELNKNDKLKEVWICVTSLLKIIQICLSNYLTDCDVENLAKYIKTHQCNKTFSVI